MSLPLLSVLMANYNHAHYLREAIPAILNQSYNPIELVIVDDGSTDDSIEVIEGYAKRDSRLHLVRHENNLGWTAAFKSLLEKFKGEYFISTSADDIILPGLFEKSMKLLSQYPQAGLCCAISERIDDDGKNLRPVPELPRISKSPCYLSPEETLDLWVNGEWDWCMPSTAVWKTKAVMEAGGFPDEAGEFADAFSVFLISLNYGACFIPEPLGVFRVRSDSLSSIYRRDPKMLKVRFEEAEKLMTSRVYADKFPLAFIREFRKRSLYEMGAVSLQGLYSVFGDLMSFPGHLSSNSNILDRWVVSLCNIYFKTGIFISKLYLFLRLRRISLYMLRRIFYRIYNRKKYRPVQP